METGVQRFVFIIFNDKFSNNIAHITFILFKLNYLKMHIHITHRDRIKSLYFSKCLRFSCTFYNACGWQIIGQSNIQCSTKVPPQQGCTILKIFDIAISDTCNVFQQNNPFPILQPHLLQPSDTPLKLVQTSGERTGGDVSGKKVSPINLGTCVLWLCYLHVVIIIVNLCGGR